MNLNTLPAIAISTILLGVGSTHAATIDFNTMTQGPSLSFDVEGVGLTVTGADYVAPDTLGAARDVIVGAQGLGVCDNLSPADGPLAQCGQPLVDAIANNGGPELVIFSFDEAVSLTSLSFNQNDVNDDVNILVGTPLGFVETYSSFGGGPTGDTITFATDVSADFSSVTTFAIGISDQGRSGNNSDQVRIQSISFDIIGGSDDTDDTDVSVVPRPIPFRGPSEVIVG